MISHLDLLGRVIGLVDLELAHHRHLDVVHDHVGGAERVEQHVQLEHPRLHRVHRGRQGGLGQGKRLLLRLALFLLALALLSHSLVVIGRITISQIGIMYHFLEGRGKIQIKSCLNPDL